MDVIYRFRKLLRFFSCWYKPKYVPGALSMKIAVLASPQKAISPDSIDLSGKWSNELGLSMTLLVTPQWFSEWDFQNGCWLTDCR